MASRQPHGACAPDQAPKDGEESQTNHNRQDQNPQRTDTGDRDRRTQSSSARSQTMPAAPAYHSTRSHCLDSRPTPAGPAASGSIRDRASAATDSISVPAFARTARATGSPAQAEGFGLDQGRNDAEPDCPIDANGQCAVVPGRHQRSAGARPPRTRTASDADPRSKEPHCCHGTNRRGHSARDERNGKNSAPARAPRCRPRGSIHLIGRAFAASPGRPPSSTSCATDSAA